ncbi:MAG: hypothetical protein BWY67_00859 [Bacteroidetes bacterium ADurb.Bin397]|nr:MAG: hypothetical protein BWY67_00859 [Bacteroidetes bacterium ADurb.Bin397]
MEHYGHEATFRKKLTEFLDKHKDTDGSDDEIINYSNWIKEKTKKKRTI